MESIKHQLTIWKNSLLAPNKNDVLLMVNPGENAQDIKDVYNDELLFDLEANSLVSKLFKQHLDHVKETGSPIFGIACNTINFSLDAINYNMPLLLAEASIKKNRFNNRFEIQQTEDFYINPFLQHLLKLEQLPEDTNEVAKILNQKGLNVQFTEGIWIANFHPHRFVLQKEFDELINSEDYSNSLKSLFAEDFTPLKISLSPHFLFPADESQRKAIELVETENIVLQGPPGTGKSQVIANLIGKALGAKKKALLVAEKSVALEVIYDQMKRKNLHHFCSLYHHELKSKNFIHSLKNTWQYLEKLTSKQIYIGEQAKFLKQGLDLTLARLRQKDLIGGISFSEFFVKYKEIKDKKTYLLSVPTIPEWEKDLLLLNELERNNGDIFGAWIKINTENNTIPEIAKQLRKSLAIIQQDFNAELSPLELAERVKESLLVDLFYYDNIALPIALFEVDNKVQKLFLKHYSTLKTLLEKENLLQIEEKHWSKSFSLSELNEYLTALNTINKFNIRSILTKRKLSKFTDLNLTDGKKVIESLIELNKVKHQIIATKEQLRKLNLPDELAVYEHINYVINKVQALDTSTTQNLFRKTQEERNTIKKTSAACVELHSIIVNNFILQEESILKQLNYIQESLPILISNASIISQIHSSTKKALQATNSLAETEAAIYHSHFLNFKGLFPELAQLNGKEIESKIAQILANEQKENSDFALAIKQRIKQQFEEYHQLLQTPAPKLTTEEKAFKQKLRKGKSVLVKAFDRKRSFPTVRELLESEASYWIELIHPVFLCSPYSVAKSIPIDYEFDLGIFDEASQIPFSNIIGSVQRSKRVVISGDEQQMAPQFYFQKKDAQQSDALHHASFYWKNSLLTNHYRSTYPQLIAFSNQYFYNNQLKTFPTPIQADAIDLIEANGIYSERTNKIEAEITAKIISEKIRKKEFDFGLVAFSQAQLDAIIAHIPRDLLQQIDDYPAVFLQALENVQGDQCQHLIISLGYAPNEEGDFHKRFGPLNQEQGHRRLNVLMSRAVSKITFIRSVNSESFSISTNEGVEMLRKLMVFLENRRTLNTIQFLPQGISVADDKMKISNPADTFSNAQEFCDYYATAKQRNWKIEIEL